MYTELIRPGIGVPAPDAGLSVYRFEDTDPSPNAPNLDKCPEMVQIVRTETWWV